MQSLPEVRQGQIIFAKVLDPRGYAKIRPLLVLSRTAEIESSGVCVAAAVTTTFTDPPPNNMITLPWHRDGNVSTGLRRRSAVVCDWLVKIKVDQVENIVGYVRSDVLRGIKQIIDAIDPPTDSQ